MLQRQAVPILEYSTQREAVINPSQLPRIEGFPKACVIAFMYEPIQTLVEKEDAPVIAHMRSVTGDFPIYRVRRNDTDIALVNCTVGAPVAAGIIEEMHAMGGEVFISYGGAGVLDRNIAVGHVLLPERALRDEGTSYHYLPPSRFVEGDQDVLAAMEEVLSREEVPHMRTTTWTTDAVYRETREKVDVRRKEGCLCVEMEVAAFMAVAKFRGLRYGALLYGGDNLDGEVWDARGWSRHEIRAHLLEMALLCAATASESL